MADRKAIEKARQQAEEMYRSGQFLCSEAVFMAANEFLGHPVPDEMVRLASGFPVGMGTAGCECGFERRGYGAGHQVWENPGQRKNAGDV